MIDEGIDTGDILFQECLDIEQKETALALTERIAKRSGLAIRPFFEKLAAGSVVPRKQEGPGSCISKRNLEWGWIPWSMDPETIDQRIRALRGYLPLVTSWNGVVIGFESGKLVTGSDQESAPTQANNRHVQNPGVVIANNSDKVVVSTIDPDYQLELDKPLILPPGQSVSINPGDQFVSQPCAGILESS